MKKQRIPKALCLAAIACCAASAGAAGIVDATGDLLPSYSGIHAGDLDVTSASVTYDAGADRFFFSGTFAAAVGTTPSAFYVWGVDRGLGTERFNTGALPIGAGITFDSVVIFRQDGSATVNRFSGPATALAGVVSFSGATISGSIDGSLLPSTGFAVADYTWNLWPRDALVPAAAGNAAISDFAPGASNAPVVAVPEPGTYALMGLGLGVLGWVARRRTRRPAPSR